MRVINTILETITLENGTAQGSTISPNGISENIDVPVNADDLIINVTGTNMETTESTLQYTTIKL